MRLGFALPQVGSMAGPDALVSVAQKAESVGYDSVVVLDRILAPVNPRAPYPASADGTLPEAFQTVLDPLESLAFVAAQTSRVALETSILNIPFYNPVLLARRLTTLDVLSKGRVRVGFGMGWSPDEFQAVNAPEKGRGERADEFLEALKAIWTTNPVEYLGKHFQVPKSIINPKPVQKPHPPIYLAAYSPPALRRTARFADGWNPGGVPVDGMRQMLAGIQGMAKEAGRDPSAIELIVRANVYVVDGASDDKRGISVGSPEQIGQDIAAVRELGAAEVQFDVNFSPTVKSLEDVLAYTERIRSLAG